MPAKKKNKQPTKDKLYTYEEYRKAFCVDPDSKGINNDPNTFGFRLAKEALAKVSARSESKQK